jgi:error-prone DNA polymerase
MVKGLNEETAQKISQARLQQPFINAADLARRTKLNDQTMRFLARAGALKQISGHRHQAHWQVAGIHPPLPLQAASMVCDAPEIEQEVMPVPSVKEDLLDDYRYTGLTLGPHPMQVLRTQRALQEYRTAKELLGYRQGQMIRIAGLVTGRQRPGTATGVVFLTLEDETGNINVVIWSSVLQRYRAALLQGQLLKIKGVVEREGAVIHVVAGHVEDATKMLADMSLHEADLKETAAIETAARKEALPFKSRDFH